MHSNMLRTLVATLLVLFVGISQASERMINASPKNYRQLIQNLGPGDRLVLEAGQYRRGLPLRGTTGEPGRPIIIEGPAKGEPAVFVGRPRSNTIDLVDVGHVVIRNLKLEGRGHQVAAVWGSANGSFNHHITLENLHISGHDAAQGIVGIGSFATAWGWIIRNNIIDGAGTGLYLGDSNGTRPFIGGLIEHNLIRNTIGYNMQIKHQYPRVNVPGMPTDPQRTIIRHNVFSKAQGGSEGRDARPNLLLGHLPLEGPGQNDQYLVYGNLFYMNPHEALLQAEGTVSIYNNLFYNPLGAGVNIRPHNHKPRNIDFLQNTVVAAGIGFRMVEPEPGYRHRLQGNVIYATEPLRLSGIPASEMSQSDNITGSLSQGLQALQSPSPTAGLPVLTASSEDQVQLDTIMIWAHDLPAGACDFEGSLRRFGVVGGYGSAEPPLWPLALERKPMRSTNDALCN